MKNIFENAVLCIHLAGIFEVLPVASAAYSEMPTDRIHTAGTGGKDIHDIGTNVVFLFLDGTDKQAIPRDGVGNKYHFPPGPAKTGSSINQLFNFRFKRIRQGIQFD